MRVILAATLLLSIAQAHAEVCVYLDKAGNKLYSNVAPEMGWKTLGCESDPALQPGRDVPPTMMG